MQSRSKFDILVDEKVLQPHAKNGLNEKEEKKERKKDVTISEKEEKSSRNVNVREHGVSVACGIF